jgi:Uma2 family endonuclease
MNEPAFSKQTFAEGPDISRIVTEDDKPLDNFFAEKQQRLLTEPLTSSWNPGRPFIAAANVGIFYDPDEPPIVPDMFLSMDVRLPEDLWKKHHRSYFVWEYGKVPEAVVELVSDTYGGEFDTKSKKYSEIGVRYYIIFDPRKSIAKDALRLYELSGKRFIPKIDRNLVRLGLGVKLWKGIFEGKYERWLRWCDHKGSLILTGFERAEQETLRAEQERQCAEQERQCAEQERLRAEKTEKELIKELTAERQRADYLAAKLKSLGISTD